jgi:hypothetical protein
LYNAEFLLFILFTIPAIIPIIGFAFTSSEYNHIQQEHWKRGKHRKFRIRKLYNTVYWIEYKVGFFWLPIYKNIDEIMYFESRDDAELFLYDERRQYTAEKEKLFV